MTAQGIHFTMVANVDQPARRRPGVRIAEALREHISGHGAGRLIDEREPFAFVALMKPCHTDAVSAAQTAHRLVLAALAHAYRNIVVLMCD